MPNNPEIITNGDSTIDESKIASSDIHWISHITKIFKEKPLEVMSLVSIIWYISIASFWEMNSDWKFFWYISFLIVNFFIYYLIKKKKYIKSNLKKIYKKNFWKILIIILFTLFIIYFSEIIDSIKNLYILIQNNYSWDSPKIS